MNREELGELLSRYLGEDRLTSEQYGWLSQYLDLLVRWNARTNLTAVRNPREMVCRHFGESLFSAGCVLKGDDTRSLVDVGSGAGFPGLVWKIFAPLCSLTLIESQNKKVTFLREVVRTLKLTNVTVFSGRAETYAGIGDVVSLRAVEKFEEIVQTAGALVGADGNLVLLISEKQVRDAERLLPDWAWEDKEAIPGGQARVVLIGKKK